MCRVRARVPPPLPRSRSRREEAACGGTNPQRGTGDSTVFRGRVPPAPDEARRAPGSSGRPPRRGLAVVPALQPRLGLPPPTRRGTTDLPAARRRRRQRPEPGRGRTKLGSAPPTQRQPPRPSAMPAAAPRSLRQRPPPPPRASQFGAAILSVSPPRRASRIWAAPSLPCAHSAPPAAPTRMEPGSARSLPRQAAGAAASFEG